MMAECTHNVESSLEFSFTCSNYKKYNPLKEYTDIQKTMEKLKNAIVKRFRIYKAPRSDEWSYMCDMGVDDDDGSVGTKGVLLFPS
ncbi:hypothetical protein DPMN_164634 [Dreissena polymorpha]|uniref:Uncharacterized protein n=1 Tax=Dreissena polymorpha TaxID=45954 RepID=A0A9D4EZ34_DREPO|nr:hypothetical protein DPMN_164634 [Dreissena polymorpha]